MKKIIGFYLLFCFALSLSAQPWMNNIPADKRGETPKFYDIQSAFNDYWEGKEIEKGKGWKQFKRWEEFMEARVYPSGELNYKAIRTEMFNARSGNKTTAGNWSHLGPDDTPTDINYGYRRGVGRVNCIAFHPTDDNIMYVGAPSGGLWITTDSGNSWSTTTDELPSMGISDIAIHPDDPSIIYIATGDGDASDTYSVGIMKSEDGGQTFTSTSFSSTVDYGLVIRRILINPQNPQIMLIATSNGIFRSTDDGITWGSVQTGHFKDMEFKPGDPTVVYAAKFGYYGNADIYKSTDGGASFSAITPAGLDISEVDRIEMAVTPANASCLYAVCSRSDNDGFHSLFKSTDEGQTWTKTIDSTTVNLLGWSSDGSDSGGQGWYDLAIAASPSDENELYIGGVNTWKSTDGGLTFDLNSHWYGDGGVAYVHADQHMLIFNENTGNLFSGNDGGLYKTSDGVNWIDISDGIQILQIYRMGSAAADENICITGAQDNGTMKYNAGVWNAVIGGDGMECFIDENNSSTMYGTVYYGALYKSTNGGYDFNEITPLAAEDGAWVTPFATEPGNSNVIYGGYTDVFKTSDAGNSWTQISTDLTGGTTLRSLAVAPSNTDVIYAATYTSIWKTTDGGTTWSDISSGFPVLSIKYITVSDTDPGNIWVSLSGYTAGEKVYTSTDGGNSWSNFSDGLPNLPVNCVLYENESNDAIYAGTDVGVYYRNESMSAWELFSEGLPNVIVNELEIHYASGKIRAATFGRGLWESDLYTSSSALELSFVVSDGICNGDCAGEIDLTVSGGAEPYSFLWSNGATTEDVINMCAGSYTVTVTDATDQDIVGDIQVDEPSVLMLGFTNVQNETSLDACDGALQVTAVGGIQPYGYLWSNGETTTDIIDLCPDMYIVTVTDYNGCTMVDSMAVDSSQSLFEVELLNMGLIDCYGDSTASLQITAHGDHPHTYSWSNGQNDSIIENLPAGVYTVTVIDVDLDTVISSYEIIQPDSILIELVMLSNESEAGNCDGSIAVDATGGSGIDQYQWSNGGNGETIDNLCSGEYELTVTDYNMCTNTTSFIITTGSVFSVDALITGGMVCQGECTSELAALPLNGTAPYSYLWSNGATDSVIANLCAGTYYLTVTDSTMVVAVDSAVIETSDILSISLDTLQHVSCLGCCDGQIAIDPDAQSGSISLLWSNGETNDTISDLCPGDYSVTLTSISGCSVDTVFTVIDPFVFNAQVDSLWQPTCYGLCDAGILVEATGGTPPYTYLWSTGATDSLVENLCSGEYYVTVQDLDSTMVIGIEIFEASPLNAEISGGLFLCDNLTELTLSLSNTYDHYQWYFYGDSIQNSDTSQIVISQIGDYSVWGSRNGCDTISEIHTVSFSDQTAEITVQPEDVSLCLGHAAVFAIDYSGDPTGYQWQKDGVDIPGETGRFMIINNVVYSDTGSYRCIMYSPCMNDTSIYGYLSIDEFSIDQQPSDVLLCTEEEAVFTVQATGIDLSYQWLKNGNPISGAATDEYSIGTVFTNDEGEYSCVVTSLCYQQESNAASLDVNLIDYTTGQIDFTPCHGDNIELALTTTGDSITYQWYQNETLIPNETNDTLSIQGLGMSDNGQYYCVLTNNCETVQTDNFSINLDEMGIVTNPEDQVVCFDTYAVFNVSAYGENLAYQWLRNDVMLPGQTDNMMVINSVDYADTASYICMVSNLCDTIYSEEAILEIDEFTITLQPSDTIVCEGSDVQFFTAAEGDNLTYQWYKNGQLMHNQNGQSIQLFDVAQANEAEYYCIIQSLCNTQSTQNASLGVFVIESSITAYNDTNNTCVGEALVSVSGGTSPYSYFWNTDSIQTNQTAVDLCSGYYTVTVTDDMGCTHVANVSIGNYNKPDDPDDAIDEFDFSDLKIYPNPVINGEFFVEYDNIQKLESVWVENSLGQRLESQVQELGNALKVSMPDISKGIYYVVIRNESSQLVKVKLSVW